MIAKATRKAYCATLSFYWNGRVPVKISSCRFDRREAIRWVYNRACHLGWPPPKWWQFWKRGHKLVVQEYRHEPGDTLEEWAIVGDLNLRI